MKVHKDIRKLIARGIALITLCVVLIGNMDAAYAMQGMAFASGLKSKITGTWLKTESKYLNLREISKNTTGQFGVLQGACTDGKDYAYFAFNRTSDDAAIIVKMLILKNSNPAKVSFKYVSKTKVLKGITHANDMAYVKNAGGSGRDKIFVINSSSNGNPTTYISTIDVASMKEESGKAYKYWKDLSECDPVAYSCDSKDKNKRTLKDLVGDHHGYSNISYNAERDMFAALVKTDRDLIILRPIWGADGSLLDLKLQRYIRQNKINATSQGIDSDESYIYTGWSAKNGVLKNNILQVYDWNGKHIGNRTVTGLYELENVFHLGNGKDARFYSGFHRSYYENKKYTKAYKVKWKKVKKYVKVKRTKKVKKIVNGKTKWIKKTVYKKKRKRVWKYKTKYRTTTKKVFVRDSYCMYLGKLKEQ